MKKLKKYIHVYTGDGKGKTTAAWGLALRAVGANKKVAIVQFMKRANYSEHKAIKKYRLPILIESFGIGYYKILGDKKPKSTHKKAAQKALKRAKEIIVQGKHEVIILDEINVAIGFGLIDINEVLSIFPADNSQNIEIILTGRKAHQRLKRTADLVTDMKKVKHYFDKGVKARKGIEY